MVLINQFINFKIGGVTVAANSTELNYNAGVTAGTALASKTLVLDASKNISGINHLTATLLTGTLQTAAQPNITSLGTLSSLNVSGDSAFGTSGSGILRIIKSVNNIYLQPAINNGTGSATHMFITNYNQNTSTSARVFSVMSDGRLGVQSINPSKQAEINSTTGNNLRLTYNNMNGTATNYTDFLTESNGNLRITTSGEFTKITKKLLVEGAINNFKEGGLIIRSLDSANFLGRTIKKEVITSLNIVDYNPAGLTDNFSIEIIGYIKPVYSQTYTFYVSYSNGTRLFINNELLFNNWGDSVFGTGTASSTILLTADIWYPIYIQNYNKTGSQQVRIEWESTGQTRQDIPSNKMAFDDLEAAVRRTFVSSNKLTIFNNSFPLSSVKKTELSASSDGDLIIKASGKDIITDDSRIIVETSTDRPLRLDNNVTAGIGSYMDIFNFENTRLLMGCGGSGTGYSTDETLIGSWTSHNLNIITGGDSRILIDTSGNVGINMSDPDEMLTVNDGNIKINERNAYADDRYIYTHWNDAGNDHQIGFEFDYYTGSGGTSTTHSRLNFVSNAELNETIDGSGKQTMMSVLSNGKVGIGTTNPVMPLDFGTGNVGDRILGLFTLVSSFYGFGANGSLLKYQTGGGHAWYTGSTTSSPGTECMRISSTGNLGIGTNNPEEILHLQSASDCKLKIEADTGNSNEANNAGILLKQDGGAVTAFIGLEGNAGQTISGSVGNNILIAGTTTNSGFQIGVNGEIRMTIPAGNGHVGIGTTSPGCILEVEDTNPEIRLTDNRTSASTAGAEIGNISWYSLDGSAPDSPLCQIGCVINNSTVFPDGDIYFRNAIDGVLSDNMVLDINGKLGIGVSDPAHMIDIQKSGADNYIRVQAGATTANYAGILLTEHNINWGWHMRFDANTDKLHIGKQSSTPTFTDVMTFLNTSYNVGIGISDPISKLHIYNQSNDSVNTILTLDSDDNTNGSGCSLDFKNATTVTTGRINNIRYNSGDYGLSFSAFNSGDMQEHMVLRDSRLGLGTTSPTELLHLKGTGPVMLKIEADSDNITETDNAGIILSQDGGGVAAFIGLEGAGNQTITGTAGNSLLIATTASATNEVIELATNNAVRLHIDDSGNIGMGTTNPSYNLDIRETGSNVELSLLRNDANGVNLQLKSQDNKARLTYNSAQGYFQIDKDNAGTLAMMFTTAGNIGINEFAPETKLHVTNASSDPVNSVLTLDSVNASSGTGLSLDFVNHSSYLVTGRINNYKYGSGDFGLVFSNYDSSLKEHMVLRNSRLGIGTNNPSATLHVHGNATIGGDDNSGLLTIKSTVTNYNIIAHNNNVTYHQASGDIFFKADGINDTTGSNIYLRNTGKCGFGGMQLPTSTIHMKQLSDDDFGGLRFEQSGTTDYWSIYQTGFGNFAFGENGTIRGYLQTGVNVSTIDFTGQHRNITDNEDINNNIQDYVGLIVYATGEYHNLNNGELNINEALPKVDLSNVYKDKRVFGVISDREENDEERTYSQGTFVSIFDKEDGDERLVINSVGEGMIWVCDKNGPIENGDLITSCEAAGYGTKQNTPYVCNYSVGKITQDCDFSEPERYVDLEGKIIDKSIYDSNPKNGFKCCFVGCVYYCG